MYKKVYYTITENIKENSVTRKGRLNLNMVYKTVKLKDGRTATLDWLKESDLPELVEALNSVIREEKYLLMDNEITDIEEERRWFKRGTKEGMLYLVARVDDKIVGGASVLFSEAMQPANFKEFSKNFE